MRATDPSSASPTLPDDPGGRERFEADLASAFAHPLRLSLMRHLAAAPACVNALVDAVQVSQPMVSRHLATLRRLELVSCRVEGRNRCYTLRQRPFVLEVLAALARVGPSEA